MGCFMTCLGTFYDNGKVIQDGAVVKQVLAGRSCGTRRRMAGRDARRV
jgi:hypothetical protein